MDDINGRQLQLMDEHPISPELNGQTISLTAEEDIIAIDRQPPAQRDEWTVSEQDDRHTAPAADMCRPQIDPLANNSPKAIVMISTPPNPGNVAADGGGASDNRMASICRTCPDSQPSKATRTSHTDDKEPTHIDSVTLKCDLNDYLINLTNIRCSLAQSNAPNVSQPVGQLSHLVDSPSNTTSGRDISYHPVDRKLGGSTYTYFDELVRCTEREREWVRCGVLPHRMPRLRLCGGGEDSINNGTSAWGTPPGASSNGTLSAWGVLPNQQQQPQQQSLPPSAWGSINNSNPGNSANNNNNNNNGGSVGSTGNVANGNGGTANSGASVGQRVGGGPSAADPNSNKVNTQSTSAPNAWNATVNHGRHGASGGTNATGNVANNNGNHHHGHNNNQQQHQQQAANMGAGNNNGAGNGTATKQLEVLNTMRDALFSQDGWGCQHVNQDTNWEVPGSPEPQGAANAGGAGGGTVGVGAKPDGAGSHGAGPNGSWKAQTMNNGTELWETNLRNGAGGPAHLQQQQQQAQQHLAQAKTAPWVPANNLGGTWMEDDDSAGGHPGGVPETAANVWNGSAASIVAGAVPLGPAGGPAGVGQAPGWGALNNGNVVAAPPTAGGAGTVGGGMWPSGGNTSVINTAGAPTTTGSMNNPQMGAIGVKKDLNEWGGGVGPIGSVGSGAVGVPGGPGMPAQVGWDARSASTAGTLPMAAGAVNGQSAGGFNINASIGGAPSDGLGNRIGGGDLRGDPRGISGRLNGAAAGSMWGTTVSDQRSGTSGGAGGVVLPGAGVAGVGGQQWGGNGTGGPNKLPTNWDDGRPSSLEDGSGGALWGQGNAGGLSRQNSTGWKDVSDVMMRPGGGGTSGGPMQRNQQHAPTVQGGGSGPFGPVPVPAGAASGVRVGTGTGGALSLGKDGMWGGQVQGIVRNGSWEDQTPGVGGWGDEKGAGGAPWNMDLASNGAGSMVGGWNKTPKSAGIGWPDPGELNSTGAAMDWGLGGKPSTGGSNKSQPLTNPLEFIRASKEYRLLCEMGHKKEDVEFALRTTSMNIEEAMELLRHGAAVAGLTTGWRRALSEDHTGGGLGMGFDGTYSGRIPPLNHATSGLSYSQNNQNMLNNIPGGGPVGGLGLDGTGPANLVALNNLKYLSQGAGGAGGAGAAHPSFNHSSLLPTGGRGPNQQTPAHQQQQQQLAAAAAAQPTNQQLRVLVQQIQLAVQNGFLNHQILNQPLAPQTFILLNQLLTHIKQMQLTQSNLARSGTTGGVSAVQLSLAINKHKTQIAQLQQQIAAQQSIYLKQQQQQQQQGHQGSMGPPPPLMQSNPNAGLSMDFMRQQQQDLMALQSTFGEMALGKDSIITSTGSVFPPPVVPLQQQQQQQQHAVVSAAPGNVIVSGGSTSQQSRLNQWKLPSLEKDPTASKDDLTDFSRAPGPSTAKSALTTTTTNTNISSLGLVQDGTWTTGRTNLADGWPEQTGDTDSKDWTTTTNTSPQDNSAFTDLVPEFEPGKPWKGTQLKIEDDPSITPGSVARSPLSIATAKDSELFGGVGGTSVTEKTSPIPADGGGLNLTSSAWSFNTASLTSVAGGTGGNKPMAGKSVWSDSSSAGGGSNVAVSSSAGVDVWCAPIVKPSATRGPPPGLGGATANKNGNGGSIAGAQQRTGAGWSSGGTSWLLLKNLTSQIDASTLRTLCMQHGPILNFHSYPAHGLALCRYATREEAAKAQQALNNCTLGSSTISAECPGSESEVQTYLQQLGGTGTSSVAVSSSASSLTSPSWRQERTPSGSGADTWGSGWALGGSGGSGTGTAANLWAPMDAGTDNGTPTSLNSFLPDSLLGPELN
ncbi:protein Gawky-like [Anopheles moucheti]|uniref:protein Gawky-like n=1 Tax=Anopheles moucheti TaxID=186751 RepID=UPI0022F043D3|nr:protein Gawky-like [Anopheles moucheti]